MRKQNAETFIDLVRSSRLLSDEQLDLALEALRKEAPDAAIDSAAHVAAHLVDKGLLTKWQSDMLRKGRYKGFYLGKYKLLSHIGVGNTSSVYLAEHLSGLRRVAIKVLPMNRAKDISWQDRFYREAQTAAVLEHPNIARIYDMDNDGNTHYLVMEYVDGENLQSMVEQKGPLDYPVAVDYIRQAARALSLAHKRGLIHGNVKPAHLILNRQNVVKVLDLGLAKFFDEQKASLIAAYDKNVLAAADYLAPEQALDSQKVDARADIYSLGCCLYFLLTGSPPFPKRTLAQKILCHQKAVPPGIREKRPDAPADLAEICAKMMAKRPEDRFQKASDVAEILTRWLITHGYEPPDDASPYGVP